MDNRFIIIKDIFRYSFSGIISQGIGIITVFIVARLLGPSDFGIFSGASLVLVYGAYVEFGALSTMGRDLPYYYGKGDMEKAAEIEGTARRTTIFGALLAAIFIISFSFMPTHSLKMALGLRAMAIVLIFQNVYTYHKIMLRSHNFFKELSQQQVLLAVLTLVLVILFVTYLGFTGRLVAAILAQAIILLYAISRNPWSTIPKFKLTVVWSVICVGLQISLSGFILSSLATVNRLMVIIFLGEKQMGYFGLAVLLKSAITLLPAMACQVLYPRITHEYGHSQNKIESIRSFVLTPPEILSILLPILIGTLYLSLPLIICILLPAYIPGITASRIVIIGIFFFGILGLTDYFLITIGKLKQYIFFGCFALFFNITLNYLLIQFGYGIEGVALGGTLITYFFYSSIVIGYSLSHYTKRFGDLIKYFIGLWFPFIYMIGVLWFVDFGFNHIMKSASNRDLFVSTIAKIICYLLFCAPLMYKVFNKLKLNLSQLILVR